MPTVTREQAYQRRHAVDRLHVMRQRLPFSASGEAMSLPYRYELTLRVTVAGDGMHADGDGAMATARRLRELVRSDDHVVDTAPLPADVRYLGKVEDHDG